MEKENVNTLNHHQKYTFNPCGLQYSKFLLKTEHLGLDDSEPFLGEGRELDAEKEKIVRGVKSVQSVNSISPS